LIPLTLIYEKTIFNSWKSTLAPFAKKSFSKRFTRNVRLFIVLRLAHIEVERLDIQRGKLLSRIIADGNSRADVQFVKKSSFIVKHLRNFVHKVAMLSIKKPRLLEKIIPRIGTVQATISAVGAATIGKPFGKKSMNATNLLAVIVG
jgi:hypothetical protein